MNKLYLLKSSDNERFKIGVSSNVWKRACKVYDIEKLDLKNSYVLEGEESFVRLEKYLHYLFDRWSVGGTKCDGYTEWFYIDCFDDVLLKIDESCLLRSHKKYTLTKGVEPSVYWVKKQERLARLKGETLEAERNMRRRLKRLASLISKFDGSNITYTKMGNRYLIKVGRDDVVNQRLADFVFQNFRISLPNHWASLVSSYSSNDKLFIFSLHFDFLDDKSLVNIEREIKIFQKAIDSLLRQGCYSDEVKDLHDKIWKSLL